MRILAKFNLVLILVFGAAVSITGYIARQFLQQEREEMPLANRRVAEYLARRVLCALCQGPRRGERPKEPPPTQASLWCAAWTPWRNGGLETEPRYVVTSAVTPMTFLSSRLWIWIQDPSGQRRLMFWVRARRGTKVRLPRTVWPEVAVWVLMRAGERPPRNLQFRGLRLLQLTD